MKTTLFVGDKSLDVVCNAFTPILFKQVFRRDFLIEFSNMSDKASDLVKKAKMLSDLQNSLDKNEITKDEYLEKYSALNVSNEGIEAISNRTELVTMLLFIMNKQSEESDPKKLYQLNELDFYGFLSQFEKNDLNKAEVINKVIAVWKGDSKPLIDSKNT